MSYYAITLLVALSLSKVQFLFQATYNTIFRYICFLQLHQSHFEQCKNYFQELFISSILLGVKNHNVTQLLLSRKDQQRSHKNLSCGKTLSEMSINVFDIKVMGLYPALGNLSFSCCCQQTGIYTCPA